MFGPIWHARGQKACPTYVRAACPAWRASLRRACPPCSDACATLTRLFNALVHDAHVLGEAHSRLWSPESRPRCSGWCCPRSRAARPLSAWRASVTGRSMTVSADSPVREKTTRTPAVLQLGRSLERLPPHRRPPRVRNCPGHRQPRRRRAPRGRGQMGRVRMGSRERCATSASAPAPACSSMSAA